MPQHPELDDQQRLERFLEWRRADDQSRKAARRHTAGMATVTVAVAALSTAVAWYAIDGHRRVAPTLDAQPSSRVALAPGADTAARKPPAAPLPVSPESLRSDSDVGASSAETRDVTVAEAAPTPAETTRSAATPAPSAAPSALDTPAASPVSPPAAVAESRAVARRKSLPPRRSARVVREAERVPAAPTTPDITASRPAEPAPVTATPMAPSSPAIVPEAPRPAVPPANEPSLRSEPAPAAVVPPPAIVSDIARTTVPPANTERVRSEPATSVAAPPVTSSPAPRRADDAVAAIAPPAQSAFPSDAPASVAEPRAPSTMETLKKWAGYMPEVRLGKLIYRWAKKQPPPDDIGLADPETPQAR